jgi:hypothetical protein
MNSKTMLAEDFPRLPSQMFSAGRAGPESRRRRHLGLGYDAAEVFLNEAAARGSDFG